MKKFVLLTAPRSGSIWLMSLLDSHPQILCAGEVFKRGDRAKIRHPQYSFQAFRRSRWLYRLPFSRVRAYDHYCRWFFENAGDNHRARGFKLMVGQLNLHQPLARALTRQAVMVVRLRRRNLVKRLVSGQVAGRDRLYVRKGRAEPPAPIRVEVENVVAQLNHLKREQRQIDTLLGTCPDYCIDYEELLADEQRALWDLQTALGVSPATLTSDARKITSDRLTDVIANYDEVRATLQGTEFAQFLTE